MFTSLYERLEAFERHDAARRGAICTELFDDVCMQVFGARGAWSNRRRQGTLLADGVDEGAGGREQRRFEQLLTPRGGGSVMV